MAFGFLMLNMKSRGEPRQDKPGIGKKPRAFFNPEATHSSTSPALSVIASP